MPETDGSQMEKKIRDTAKLLKEADYVVAFTGAGMSAESGIPTFRGSDGLWGKYDPELLTIGSFMAKPLEGWQLVKDLFFDVISAARPNPGHYALAELEHMHRLHCIITQNIDYLHQDAGNRVVCEFHGTIKSIICPKCSRLYPSASVALSQLPPHCADCQTVLKPNFVFFDEAIPVDARENARAATLKADVMLVIGTSGAVPPACYLPDIARENGAMIIEINPEPTQYTKRITDIYLNGNAGDILPKLVAEVKSLIETL